MARSQERIRIRERGNGEPTLFKKIVRIAIVIFACALFFVAIWYVTRVHSLTLREVTVSGGETISDSEIQTLVERELEGAYLLLIPKRFAYLYPQDRILEVLQNIPRIAEVSVERLSRTELHITFTEYVPFALSCVYQNEDAPCFYMDAIGFAFEEAPLLSGGTLVRHMFEGTEVNVREDVLDDALLERINDVLKKMEDEINLRVSTIVHKRNGDIEFIVNGGGKILTSSSQDFDETFANLKTLLDSEAFTHIEPGNFNYIDVRFGNKLFVNEVLESEGTDQVLSATSTDEEVADEPELVPE